LSRDLLSFSLSFFFFFVFLRRRGRRGGGFLARRFFPLPIDILIGLLALIFGLIAAPIYDFDRVALREREELDPIFLGIGMIREALLGGEPDLGRDIEDPGDRRVGDPDPARELD
jgi:hypothetical protein